MTEDTGFPFRPDPAEDDATPDTETAPDAAPGDDTPPADDAAEAAPASQEAVPFVPDTGVADWLREFIHSTHRRLTNLGG